MSTFNGLPLHILLNHFIVVLGPLTAILAILCVVWPAARRRLGERGGRHTRRGRWRNTATRMIAALSASDQL